MTLQIGDILDTGSDISFGMGKVKIVKTGASHISLWMLSRQKYWDDQCVEVADVFNITTKEFSEFSVLAHSWRKV